MEKDKFIEAYDAMVAAKTQISDFQKVKDVIMSSQAYCARRSVWPYGFVMRMDYVKEKILVIFPMHVPRDMRQPVLVILTEDDKKATDWEILQ